jgi:hypothetical protein
MLNKLSRAFERLRAAPAQQLRLAVVCCCVIQLAACDARNVHADSGWFFADLAPPVVIADDQTLPTFSLEEVGRYGSLDGIGALDWVRQVAANDEVIVAHDIRSCEFVVFDRTTKAALHRFGGCGSGPDAYQSPEGFFMRIDSLLILDARGNRLTWTGLNGTILSRWNINHTESDAKYGVEIMSLIGDSVLVLAVGRSGGAVKASTLGPHPFVTLYRTDSAIRMGGLLLDGPNAVIGSRGMAKSVYGCVLEENGRPHLAVMNDWVPQLVKIDMSAEPRVVRNQYLPRVTMRPKPRVDDPGAMHPPGLLRVACSGDWALASWRRTAEPYKSGMLTNAATMLLFASSDELPSVLEVDSTSAHVLGDPVGAHESTLFVFHRTRYDVPTIIELKVRR